MGECIIMNFDAIARGLGTTPAQHPAHHGGPAAAAARHGQAPEVSDRADVSPSSISSSLPGIAGFLELVGGVLLILGLFTRTTAFILSGMMAVAYFIAHAPRGFYPILNGGELAALYCFVFLYIAAAGPGPWSLDAHAEASSA